MANINSLYSSSSVSSIYGNRNIISGLASGMDTESMIENAVAGIKTKIANLQKQSTKLTWKQDAYRSIIDKMASFTSKYTSYVSDTNLSSQSFFNSAATMTPNGKYADKVTASGKTNSDIQILGIKQLATAATYRTFGAGNTGSVTGIPTITAGTVDLGENQPLSNVSGSMTIKYGGRSFDLNFDELEVFKSAEGFAAAIKNKLGEINVTNSSGETVTADTMVDVKVENGNIVFGDKQKAGNSVYISSASGDIQKTLDIKTGDKPSTLTIQADKLYNEDGTKGQYLSGKEFKVTLDGITKTLKMPEYDKDDPQAANKFVEGIQDQLDNAFGTDKIKAANKASDGKMQLEFTTQRGSTMSISSDVGEALGFNGKNAFTYTDNSTKLKDILTDGQFENYAKIEANGEGKLVKVNNKSYYTDNDGNRVAFNKDDNKWYRVDEEGDYLHEFKLNGKTVGTFSKNTAMESVMTAVNNSESGVKVSYSKTTNEYVFTAKESGSNGRIQFGQGLEDLFGKVDETDHDSYTAGTDAIFSMTVNGQTYDSISRSSNSFEIDGMTLNLKGTFGAYDDNGIVNQKADDYEAISFTAGTDTDKIVDAVKSMVNDYNEMITEIKNAYSTQPAYKDSKYTRYEPLTEEEAASLTDTELENYEKKAKQGLLFGDSNLSALYNQLRSAITSSTSDYNLNEIGLSTNYSDGLTTISLDEKKLRSAIESNPDKVKSLFTKTKENGATTDGIMANMKKTLDTYAKTTGDKGILINLAGSVKAPASLNSNSLNTQINNVQKQIDKWTEKYTDRVDYYTRQFTKLEQLIAQMNSQSSALSGLMGGSTGY